MKLSRILNVVLALGLLTFGYVIFKQDTVIRNQRRILVDAYLYIISGCPGAPHASHSPNSTLSGS